MKHESYKGRKLKTVKGREYGYVRHFVNGVNLGRHMGDEESALDYLRRTIDFADEVGVSSGRMGAEWYAPGTFELCEEGHPKEIGGDCGHHWCVEQRSELAPATAEGGDTPAEIASASLLQPWERDLLAQPVVTTPRYTTADENAATEPAPADTAPARRVIAEFRQVCTNSQEWTMEDHLTLTAPLENSDPFEYIKAPHADVWQSAASEMLQVQGWRVVEEWEYFAGPNVWRARVEPLVDAINEPVKPEPVKAPEEAAADSASQAPADTAPTPTANPARRYVVTFDRRPGLGVGGFDGLRRMTLAEAQAVLRTAAAFKRGRVINVESLKEVSDDDITRQSVDAYPQREYPLLGFGAPQCIHGNAPNPAATGKPIQECRDARGTDDFGVFSDEGCIYTYDCAVDVANEAVKESAESDYITWSKVCTDHAEQPAGTCAECNSDD